MAAPPLAFEAGFTVNEQIEARARHPEAADKVVIMHGDRSWTYRQFRDQCVRMSHFLLRRLGAIDDRRPGHVAMVLENHPELLALYGGCAYGGLTLFGVNTGLRDNGPLGYLFSIVCIVVAALSFILDFDQVEQGVRMGLPQRYSWVCAFGILVSLVWLYLEILRLLSYLQGSSRD